MGLIFNQKTQQWEDTENPIATQMLASVPISKSGFGASGGWGDEDLPVAVPKPKPIDKRVLASLAQKYPEAKIPIPEAMGPAEPSLFERYHSDFSPEKLKAAQDDASERKSGLGWAQFAAGIGDALQGKSPSQSAATFDQIRKNIDADTVGAYEKQKASALQDISTKKALNNSDVNSDINKKLRASIMASAPKLAAAMGDNFNKLTVDDYDYIMKPHQFAEQVKSREQTAAILAGQRADAAKVKADEKLEKKKALVNEVEDRRQNINASLDTVDKMIEDDGTWELLGSHNQDMERLIESIATDMAKLQDPASVARPSEVEAVKQNLIRSGFKNSNETARAIIKNFRSEVARRADTAYKVRGLDVPTGGKDISQFPKQLRKDGKVATVNSEAELREAQAEGWQ